MCAFGRAATDIPGPVLMRFMFESVNRIHETMIYRPDTFRDTWIHFVSLIRETGANNVEFIFHPNSGNDGILGRWYPGDEYVDWLGCSLFNPRIFKTVHGPPSTRCFTTNRSVLSSQHRPASRFGRKASKHLAYGTIGSLPISLLYERTRKRTAIRLH